MPKRKLSDLADSTPSHSQISQKSKENANIKLQTTRLKQQFEFGVTTLSRALKVATGFERQKLGRRQKEAKAPPAATTAQDGDDDNANMAGKHNKRVQIRNKNKNKKAKANVDPEVEVKRIEGEIQVLKTLDPMKTAEKYLFKQLAKTKRIEETQVFYRFKQSKKISLDGPKSSEEANVTARLFMSNPVKNVLPGIMEGLRGLFGLEEAGAKNKNANGKGAEKDQDKQQQKQKAGGAVRRDVSVSGDEDEEDSGDEARDVDGDMGMEDAASDSEEKEEDYSHFDARLAPDSEDEDEDGNLSETSGPRPRRSSMSITPSPSPSPSISQSASISHPSPPPSKKPKTTKASTAPATSTTFLPSLMMGGYWSGSEEEASDIEASTDVAPKRKNRMGQQARRALWEKKYGAGANHVKNQKVKGKGKGRGRDSGWDLRKGATGDGDGDRRRFGTGSNSMAVTGERMNRGSSEGSKKKVADANKPLHPSWEAARKAKEAKATAAFSGKKVVFD
ncbi:BUD22 family protein [Aspergillus undulatus]|uniref:BUD22 family protein n=1 Tax=Aspergillus undulatus TaxID=1810928 RepID=UPI003CCCFA16